jgi:predicted dithiol-disulfide oxidoreductase (DUF899 family)
LPASARGWTFPWYSSFGSDFNYDFHATLDPKVAPASYNYRDADEWLAAGSAWMTDYVGEQPGISCFCATATTSSTPTRRSAVASK